MTKSFSKDEIGHLKNLFIEAVKEVEVEMNVTEHKEHNIVMLIIEKHWPQVLASLMLLLALGSWPYSYFQVLRFFIFIFGIYFAKFAREQKEDGWQIVFIIILAVFNPLVPLYLDGGSWHFIDLICAIVILVSTKKVSLDGLPYSRHTKKDYIDANKLERLSGRSYKIAMVESDKFIVNMYSSVFKKHGFRFFEFNYAEPDFVDKISSLKPDLICMNTMLYKVVENKTIGMPSGFEVIKLLKADARTKNTPVFFLTNQAQDDDIKMGILSGAEKYITMAETTPGDLLAIFSDFLSRKKG